VPVQGQKPFFEPKEIVSGGTGVCVKEFVVNYIIDTK
jgi:hypothetical protein